MGFSDPNDAGTDEQGYWSIDEPEFEDPYHQERARAAESFEVFYTDHYRPVVGLAYALTGSRSASEELAQDAFAKAFRRWGHISGYENPGAWVRRVLVNASRSRGRRLGTEVKALARLGGRRQRLAELPQPDHEFWAAVRALPKRQAQAIALHYLEDRPVDQIAEILDCTPGTVKQHLHRGRRALAVSLDLSGPASADPDTDKSTREEGR